MSASTSTSFSAVHDRMIKDGNKGTGLKKCFTALVDRKQVCLDIEVLILMLKKELLIKMDSFHPDLVSILPYMLIYYIKTWPGWQKSSDYFSGKIQFKAWYEKFHKYIVLKLNQLISEGYQQAKAELDEIEQKKMEMLISTGKLVNRGAQTDNLAPKGFSPFTIDISVSPSAASTVVFTDNNKGDVILKHHNELEWGPSVVESITLNQLIHWPNVEIHFACPFFEFKRKNKHTYKRQIGLVSLPYVHEVVDYIEEISTLDENATSLCYTLEVMKQVCDALVQTLREVVQDIGKLQEIITVVDEFLLDIVDLNIGRDGQVVMASNSLILFNIGRSSYFRNKKLSKGAPSRTDINFVETIIPKAEISLIKFDHGKAADNYLTILKEWFLHNKQLLNEGLPKISYFCNFCNLDFDGATVLLAHLKEVHKMEQRVLCTTCKKSFPIVALAKDRWKHMCTKKQ